MSRIYKTLKAQKKVAMAFIGRTFARLRHLQKKSKLSIDAVQLCVQGSVVSIYLDGIELLKATRDGVADWNIALTEKLENLLQTQQVA